MIKNATEKSKEKANRGGNLGSLNSALVRN